MLSMRHLANVMVLGCVIWSSDIKEYKDTLYTYCNPAKQSHCVWLIILFNITAFVQSIPVYKMQVELTDQDSFLFEKITVVLTWVGRMLDEILRCKQNKQNEKLR